MGRSPVSTAPDPQACGAWRNLHWLRQQGGIPGQGQARHGYHAGQPQRHATGLRGRAVTWRQGGDEASVLHRSHRNARRTRYQQHTDSVRVIVRGTRRVGRPRPKQVQEQPEAIPATPGRQPRCPCAARRARCVRTQRRRVDRKRGVRRRLRAGGSGASVTRGHAKCHEGVETRTVNYATQLRTVRSQLSDESDVLKAAKPCPRASG